MKSIIYHALALVISAAVLSACSNSEAGDKQSQLESLKKQQADLTKEIASLEKELQAANPEAATNVKAKEVSATEVTVTTFNHYIQTQGKIESEENIMISAKSMGSITRVFVKEGQSVSKNQVLAQIDNAAVVSSIESLKAQLSLVNAVYDRQKNLWDQKIGTEVQFLTAKSNKESLEKQLAALNEQNDATRIKSPINGTVDELFAKVGMLASPGVPAARVVNTVDLTLKTSVSEAYVTNVKVGNKAIVSIPELKRDVEARVSFVGRTIDVLSRTFTVEVDLPSLPELRPNMSGVVKVIYYSDNAALTVPVNTVQTVNDQKIVYVAELDGKNLVARKRVVEVAGVFDNKAHITKGIAAGEKVITFGFQGLSDGQVIKL
jgi:membrane fusion protein, multidrug efflux system